MINRKISVHLQNFPDVSFLPKEDKLVSKMDLVREICSTALSIRDNKNLRVRLPLNLLKIIGKNAAEVSEFKEIIADEVNVKNIEIIEEIQDLAELKLQVNFKKIGAKYGSKVKDITAAVKNGDWKKISDKEISIAGISLVDDEFEIKLTPKNQDDKKFALAALPSNDCLIQLDIEITEDLEQEGIARDIVRAVQQSRKDADLNVSDNIILKISSPNQQLIKVAQKFGEYIKEQTLANSLQTLENKESIQLSSKFFFESKIDDGEIFIGISIK